MYAGKLVFAQVMEHLPLHTLRRSIAGFEGDRYAKGFSCQDQFRCMAFAQLTYRESLRDTVTCLNAQAGKLYHMGIRGRVFGYWEAKDEEDDLDGRIVGCNRPIGRIAPIHPRHLCRAHWVQCGFALLHPPTARGPG